VFFAASSEGRSDPGIKRSGPFRNFISGQRLALAWIVNDRSLGIGETYAQQYEITKNAYTIVPNNAPTPAVIPIANAPQNVTLVALRIIGVPPARAAKAPSRARKTSEVTNAARRRLVSGTKIVTKRGTTPPTKKQAADASAAWNGRARNSLDIPNSSRACALRASWAMSWSATFLASNGSTPRPT
jgi:hypothetical protein